MPGQPGNIEGLGMGAAQVGHNGQLFVPFQVFLMLNLVFFLVCVFEKIFLHFLMFIHS